MRANTAAQILTTVVTILVFVAVLAVAVGGAMTLGILGVAAIAVGTKIFAGGVLAGALLVTWMFVS
jgi:hypothetical protein